MVILSIDYGTKNIGLAVSDETEFISAPLPIHINYGDERAALELAETIKKQRVEKIVLGLPMKKDEQGLEIETQMTKQIKKFAELLAQASGLQPMFWDESFSSSSVESKLRGKKIKASDSIVAAKLLQEYLDYQREFKKQ